MFPASRRGLSFCLLDPPNRGRQQGPGQPATHVAPRCRWSVGRAFLRHPWQSERNVTTHLGTTDFRDAAEADNEAKVRPRHAHLMG